jgi:hypothetical protein
MQELHNSWITEGLMDPEYKKYILLAYLKSCRDQFGETKLYPPLSDLVRHYQNLNELNQSLDQLQSAFPKEVSGIDLSGLRFQYEQQKQLDENILNITEIIDFAIPSMRGVIEEGREIYELVEKNLEIQPLGIVPMYNQEGYILIHEDHSSDVYIYQFQHSVIVSPHENMRSLSLNYIYKEVKSIANTFEQMKLRLIQSFQHLPHPAAYLCISKLHVPLLETLLPVTKRVLMTRVFP